MHTIGTWGEHLFEDAFYCFYASPSPLEFVKHLYINEKYTTLQCENVHVHRFKYATSEWMSLHCTADLANATWGWQIITILSNHMETKGRDFSTCSSMGFAICNPPLKRASPSIGPFIYLSLSLSDTLCHCQGIRWTIAWSNKFPIGMLVRLRSQLGQPRSSALIRCD